MDRRPLRSKKAKTHTTSPYDRPSQGFLGKVCSTVKGLFSQWIGNDTEEVSVPEHSDEVEEDTIEEQDVVPQTAVHGNKRLRLSRLDHIPSLQNAATTQTRTVSQQTQSGGESVSHSTSTQSSLFEVKQSTPIMNDVHNRSLWSSPVSSNFSPSVKFHSRPPTISLTNQQNFNLSSFVGPSKVSQPVEKITSPFYEGKTSFGGASAASRRMPSSVTPYQVDKSVRNQIKVREHKSDDSLEGMSSAAKRILLTLEKMSTPVSDAKKIPNSKTSPVDLSLYLAPPKSRRNSQFTPSISKGPPIANINSIAKLAQLKNYGVNKLRAVPITPVTPPTDQVNPSVDILQASTSITSDNNNSQSQSQKSGGGKMKNKLNQHHQSAKESDSILEPLSLPNVPLTIVNLPKIDFSRKTSEQTPELRTRAETNKIENKVSSFSKGFTFSKPIEHDFSNTNGIPPSMNLSAFESKCNKIPMYKPFVFSSPIEHELPNKTVLNTSATRLNENHEKASLGVSKSKTQTSTSSSFVTTTSDSSSTATTTVSSPALQSSKSTIPHSQFSSHSVTATSITFGMSPTFTFNKSQPNKTQSTVQQTRASSFMFTTSSTSSIFGSKPDTKSQIPNAKSQNPNASSKTATTSAPAWECSTCWVSNPDNISTCLACETPKQIKEVSTNKTASSATWECSACWVKSPETASVCIACETPKQPKVVSASKSSTSSSSTWECSACWVRNAETALKCISCETPKQQKEVSDNKSTSSKLTEKTDDSTKSNFLGIVKASAVGTDAAKTDTSTLNASSSKSSEVAPSSTSQAAKSGLLDFLKASAAERETPKTNKPETEANALTSSGAEPTKSDNQAQSLFQVPKPTSTTSNVEPPKSESQSQSLPQIPNDSSAGFTSNAPEKPLNTVTQNLNQTPITSAATPASGFVFGGVKSNTSTESTPFKFGTTGGGFAFKEPEKTSNTATTQSNSMSVSSSAPIAGFAFGAAKTESQNSIASKPFVFGSTTSTVEPPKSDSQTQSLFQIPKAASATPSVEPPKSDSQSQSLFQIPKTASATSANEPPKSDSQFQSMFQIPKASSVTSSVEPPKSEIQAPSFFHIQKTAKDSSGASSKAPERFPNTQTGKNNLIDFLKASPAVRNTPKSDSNVLGGFTFKAPEKPLTTSAQNLNQTPTTSASMSGMEGFVFGAKSNTSSESTPSFSFGSTGGGFTYKAPEKSNAVISQSNSMSVSNTAPTSGFVFGAVKTEAQNSTAPPSFVFGSSNSGFAFKAPEKPLNTPAQNLNQTPTTSTSTPATVGFAFGVKSDASTESTPSFTFGSTGGGFGFKAPEKTPNLVTSQSNCMTVSNTTPTGGFAFGAVKSEAQNSTAPTHFVFGSSTMSQGSTGFGNATLPAFGSNDTKPQAVGGFSFGATPSAPVFQFGASMENKPVTNSPFNFGTPTTASETNNAFGKPFALNTPPTFNFGATSTPNAPAAPLFQFQASNEGMSVQSSAPSNRKTKRGIRRVPRN